MGGCALDMLYTCIADDGCALCSALLRPTPMCANRFAKIEAAMQGMEGKIQAHKEVRDMSYVTIWKYICT